MHVSRSGPEKLEEGKNESGREMEKLVETSTK